MPLHHSPAASSRTAAQSGFSLVELLVVLGIIATMAGLVLGGLFRYHSDYGKLFKEYLGEILPAARVSVCEESGALGAREVPLDPELVAVVNAWPTLSESSKAGILAITDALEF